MPDRVNLDRARRIVGQLNGLGGKPFSGRPTVRVAAWVMEQLVAEVESLRAECIAQAGRRKPKPYDHSSYRLFRTAPATEWQDSADLM